MEEKLNRLYEESVSELKEIGLDVNNPNNGEIEIKLSKRNNKRYGCCKQEAPDKNTKYYEKIGNKRYLRYAKYNKHTIEISKWVMMLDESIIKNTIIHEIIHCLPYCNNHKHEFKKYANYINERLGYDISRVGNKKEDYKKSDMEYIENVNFKYKIICEKCNQTFYRQRLMRNLTKKYRCGICGGKLKIFYKLYT